MAIRRRSGGTTVVFDERHRSPTQISPPSGVRKPATRRSVVVFPQPEGPSSATSSRGLTSSERSSTAATPASPPYRLLSPRSVTPGNARLSVLRAQKIAAEDGLHQEHDAAPGQRRRDLAQHAQAPGAEDAPGFLQLWMHALERRVGLCVADRQLFGE